MKEGEERPCSHLASPYLALVVVGWKWREALEGLTSLFGSVVVSLSDLGAVAHVEVKLHRGQRLQAIDVFDATCPQRVRS